MIGWLKSNVKTVAALAIAAVLLTLIARVTDYIADKNRKIAELITKLATAEQTIEIEKGVFAKKAAEVEDLKGLIATIGEENTRLSELVEKGRMEVLTLNELVIKWKRAYQGIVDSQQSDVPSDDPEVPGRKRVEFQGQVGPFLVLGHTLTDPSEAWLQIEQVDPLKLLIAVTRNRDGTFSTFVDSGSTDVEVDISVSAVDPAVLSPKWYQRIWVHGSGNFMGTDSAQLGLSYQFDRWSLGATCMYGGDGLGCGVQVGFRPFR